ncbi:MAG: GNAT family N-acetyltransferase [Deltaproteobacteria bacterium]|nr:GNAT family N-acetyltransferase [Deltaproteobacteria bacterium]
MHHRVLDAAIPAERAEWLALWERWPGREVFAHPEYVRLFARPCDRAVCAVGEDESGAILFPLVLRPLAEEPWAPPGERRFDAVSPYGYGGPFAFGGGARDDESFWRAHAGYCREAGILSTFVRLSLFEAQLPRLPGSVEARGPNVVRALGPNVAAIWMEYERSVRANVKTAERSGVEIDVDRSGARLEAFMEVYEHTMRRRGANGWYFFPRSFFEDLVRNLAGQFVFFHALHAGEVVSSELVLISREHAYMFLSGTTAEAYPLRPNDLLRHRTVEWAAAEGLRSYVLGGGYQPGDGVYRHKKNFAPRGQLPFRVACLTHDEAAARELEERRAAAGGAGWVPRPGYFPRYRG